MSQLIVCERTNRWAVALRWALAKQPVRIYETRTWDDAWQALQSQPHSLVAIELRPGLVGEVVHQLRQVSLYSPRAIALVLTDRGMAEHEWLLREAGAWYVAISPRNLSSLARLAGRFCQRAPREPALGEMLEEASAAVVREVVWRRLPWPRD